MIVMIALLLYLSLVLILPSGTAKEHLPWNQQIDEVLPDERNEGELCSFYTMKSLILSRG